MLELNIPEVIAEVTEAFTRYERALVANDVAALDMLFWNSTHTLRFGIGENLYGYESIAAFRNARPPIDLRRQLQNTFIVSYGRDLATANTEFRRDGSRSIGRQSHVWLRTEGGWRIAAAHVSLMPASGSMLRDIRPRLRRKPDQNGLSINQSARWQTCSAGGPQGSMFADKHLRGCQGTSAIGLVSRVTPVHTAMRNCTRDEGRPFEFGNQVLISSHRKLLSSKATVVNVAETSGHDLRRHG
jgi:Protein of unknown function (DUF3225)